MKKFLLLLTLFIFCLSAQADVIWPSLYIAKGMCSIKIIIIGLIVELLFVKYCTKVKWLTACWVSCLMNVITAAAGIILIPLSGLIIEFSLLPFHLYEKFNIGTFHWSHWLLSYFAVIFINTIIECLVIKLCIKAEFRKIFWWLLCANAISVILCGIFLIKM